MTKQQLLATIRQMQQFLKGQETRFVEGLRIMKHRLTTLQNTVTKAIPDPQTGKKNTELLQRMGQEPCSG